MTGANAGVREEELKERLLEILDEDEAISFREIKTDIQGVREERIREALIDLLDKNRVVANANWEYRQRTLDLEA